MTALTFHLVLHTHWDREWYRPEAEFRARLVPMMDDLLDALERDPTFRSFLLDGQTVLVEDYLAVRPDAAERLRRLVAAGQLQVGPWYVLADELTPSAESLVRNLLIGTADAERLGGRLAALYSPDAFGHPAALPSLAREFGIDAGVLWRGLAPRAGDGDLFRWRAPDGAGLFLYHLPRDGYEIGAALPADAAALPAAWARVRDGLVGRARSPHVAVFVGADHHAAHPDPVRLRDLLAALEPAHQVRISRLDEFLAAAAQDAHAVPDITGELRWSYGYTWTLQGTHGTRLPLKRANARAELGFERFAEPLAALAMREGGRDRRPLLRAGWRTLVQAHFHDTICGCSHDEVALTAARRIADARAAARAVTLAAVHQLAGHDADRARESDERTEPALVIWNPAARRRQGVAMADLTIFRHDILVGPPGERVARVAKGAQAFALVDGEGRVVPFQVIERREGIERVEPARHYPDADAVEVVRVAFETPSLSGLGMSVLRPGRPAAPRPAHPARADGRKLTNGLIEATLRADGTVSLRDLRTGERYAALLGAESEPDRGDAYTFERSRRVLPRRAAPRAEVRTIAAGPLVAITEARWDALDASFRLVLSLRAGEPFARVALDVDNRGRDRRLRLRLPLALPGIHAVAGAPFGSERRAAMDPDPAGFPAEQPVATAPAQRFAGVAQGPRGLALLAPGHFEYEWTAGGDLFFTLLRSVGELSRDDLRTRPGHAGWPTPVPGAQCPGHTRVELALAPIAEAALTGSRVHELWEDAFLPPACHWIRNAEPLAPTRACAELDGEGLVLSAVKPPEADEGLILRCCNATDEERDGTWWVTPPPAAAWRVRADERMPTPIPVDERTGAVRFRAGAREIMTVRVR